MEAGFEVSYNGGIYGWLPISDGLALGRQVSIGWRWNSYWNYLL